MHRLLQYKLEPGWGKLVHSGSSSLSLSSELSEKNFVIQLGSPWVPYHSQGDVALNSPFDGACKIWGTSVG